MTIKWQNLVFQALPELETATPLSSWKLPNSCTGMDTISRGGERPPFLRCGTSGSLLTPQGSFILCEDKQGTNRMKGQFFRTLDQSNPSKTAPCDTSGTTGHKVFFICHMCPWVRSSFPHWPVYSYITLTTQTWSFFLYPLYLTIVLSTHSSFVNALEVALTFASTDSTSYNRFLAELELHATVNMQPVNMHHSSQKQWDSWWRAKTTTYSLAIVRVMARRATFTSS